MKELAQLLNEMQAAGVIENYALFAAMAQMRIAVASPVGRAKDYARILALLESSAATREEIARLAATHGLSEAWRRFEARFGDE